jgi:hypothetical protein
MLKLFSFNMPHPFIQVTGICAITAFFVVVVGAAVVQAFAEDPIGVYDYSEKKRTSESAKNEYEKADDSLDPLELARGPAKSSSVYNPPASLPQRRHSDNRLTQLIGMGFRYFRLTSAKSLQRKLSLAPRRSKRPFSTYLINMLHHSTSFLRILS